VSPGLAALPLWRAAVRVRRRPVPDDGDTLTTAHGLLVSDSTSSGPTENTKKLTPLPAEGSNLGQIAAVPAGVMGVQPLVSDM